MERLVQNARAKMGVAETTTDETYEKHRIFLKQLCEVTRTATSAVNRAVTALSDAVNALQHVHRSFDQLLGIGHCCAQVADANANFGAALQAVRDHALPDFAALVRAECLATIASLESDHERVEQLRQERKRLVDTYDYFKNELTAKEREYQKKGRPLTESKTYAVNTSKMEEAEAAFTAAHRRFTDACDNLQRRKLGVTALNLQCFLEHSGRLLGALHRGIHSSFLATCGNTHPT